MKPHTRFQHFGTSGLVHSTAHKSSQVYAHERRKSCWLYSLHGGGGGDGGGGSGGGGDEKESTLVIIPWENNTSHDRTGSLSKRNTLSSSLIRPQERAHVHDDPERRALAQPRHDVAARAGGAGTSRLAHHAGAHDESHVWLEEVR